MRRAIREHLRDFIAILTLLVLGLAATVAILSQQQAVYPSWIPFLGDERFELKAEFTSAQAVTPGQGQTVNIAGVEVGDVSKVELEDGDRDRDAVDPGRVRRSDPRGRDGAAAAPDRAPGHHGRGRRRDRGASRSRRARRSPSPRRSRTCSRTRSWPRSTATPRPTCGCCCRAAREGFGGNGEKLSAGLRRLEPFARDVAKINGLLSQRRQNIRSSIHNFRVLSPRSWGATTPSSPISSTPPTPP